MVPVYLSDKDADAVLERLHEKKPNGEIFTEEDFAQLALTPLMGSKKERTDVILESLNLSKTERSITAEKVMAMLYTLADKFLEEKDLEEVKEAVAMTRIGQMIYDDGVIRGREEGRIAGRVEGQKAGAERMSALTAKLLKEKRLEDLQRATEDEEFREKLMKEFGIL